MDVGFLKPPCLLTLLQYKLQYVYNLGKIDTQIGCRSNPSGYSPRLMAGLIKTGAHPFRGIDVALKDLSGSPSQL